MILKILNLLHEIIFIEFFLIFSLWKVSVAEESYCEISVYYDKYSIGDIIILEKDYINSSSLEKKLLNTAPLIMKLLN